MSEALKRRKPGRREAYLSFLQTNFTDCSLSIEAAAAYFQLLPSAFSRNFKEEFGLSFPKYLTQLRIDRSKELLRSTALTVDEIAEHPRSARNETARLPDKCNRSLNGQFKPFLLCKIDQSGICHSIWYVRNSFCPLLTKSSFDSSCGWQDLHLFYQRRTFFYTKVSFFTGLVGILGVTETAGSAGRGVP